MKMTFTFSLSSLVFGGATALPPSNLAFDRLGDGFFLLLLLVLLILDEEEVADIEIAASATSSFVSEFVLCVSSLTGFEFEIEHVGSLSSTSEAVVGSGGSACDTFGSTEEGGLSSAISSHESTSVLSCVGGVPPSLLLDAGGEEVAGVCGVLPSDSDEGCSGRVVGVCW